MAISEDFDVPEHDGKVNIKAADDPYTLYEFHFWLYWFDVPWWKRPFHLSWYRQRWALSKVKRKKKKQ